MYVLIVSPHFSAKAAIDRLTLNLQHCPTLALQPLRFHIIARLPHLRFLGVVYGHSLPTAVLHMYPSSFMRDELGTLRSTTLQEITIQGHPQSNPEPLLCQFSQGSWFMYMRGTKIIV